MFKLFDEDKKLTIFAMGLFLYMCIENDLCITLLIPNSLRYLGGLLIPLACMYYKKLQKFGAPHFFTVLFFLYYFWVSPSIWAFLDALVKIVSVISILSLNMEKKVVLLDLLKSYFTVMVGVSLLGWSLFLAGVNLPYENVEMNDFHNDVNNYYLFSISIGINLITDFLRFSGMFLEPGQLATPCVLFMFSNGGVLKDKRNIILLIAVILTFSLVAYAMLLLGYSIKSIIVNRKHLFLKMLVPLSLVLGTGFVMYQEANDNNPVYALILSRLESDDDKGFVGNNRTNDYVDVQFDKLMRSPQKWRGISAQYLQQKSDWLSDSSGYKKFILLNGLLGVIFLALLVYSLYAENKSNYNFLFLMLVVMAFMPRAMLTKAMWFYPVILTFYLNNNNKNLSISEYHGQKQNSKKHLSTTSEFVQ